MTAKIDEMDNDDYLDDYDDHICPYTKKRCYTPWLAGDCPNDCPMAHEEQDW